MTNCSGTMVQLPSQSPRASDNPFDDTESIPEDDNTVENHFQAVEKPQEATEAPEEVLNTNDQQDALQQQITEDANAQQTLLQQLTEDAEDSELILPSAVTVDRKRDLLREARADRVAWILSVPLPYATEGSSLLDTTHIVKELPSATKVLTHLYGDQNLESRLEQLISKDSTDGDGAIRTGDEVLEGERKDRSKDTDLQGVLNDYQEFCRQLKLPESAVVVNGIRNSLQRLGTDPATTLRNHVASTLEQLKRQQQHQQWTKRSLESFLYGQAHIKIMYTLAKERIEDEKFHEKLKTLSFVSAKHLDLTCFVNSDNDHLGAAVDALLFMQTLHSPYEKLQRILKSYHCVNEALKTANNGKLPSADDVLPTLILTVLQAKPKQMVSNLRMLEVFSPPEYLRGEAGYAYTNLYGAVQFLLDLDLTPKKDDEPITSLTITAKEFREGLEASRAAIEEQLEACNKSKIVVLDAADVVVEPPKSVEIPVAEVRAARLRGEVVDVEWARQNFVSSDKTATTATGEGSSEDQDVPLPTGFTRNYTFLTSRPEEIRVVDLPQLLGEYRMLVRTTETLLAERAQRSSMERKERLLRAEKAIQESALKVELGLKPAPS